MATVEVKEVIASLERAKAALQKNDAATPYGAGLDKLAEAFKSLPQPEFDMLPEEAAACLLGLGELQGDEGLRRLEQAVGEAAAAVEALLRDRADCRQGGLLYLLGLLYENSTDEKAGLGEKAVACYKGAAQQGCALAQWELFNWYIGDGADEQEAYKWLREAAEGGHKDAQNTLGVFLKEGTGSAGAADMEEAKKWFRKAAEQGLPQAQFNLAQCYERDEGEKAYKWYEKAAEQDYSDAQVKVGEYLKNGVGGIPSNEKEAFTWYKRAAEQENEEGQYQLGYCYEFNFGVDPDLSKALQWYIKAADRKHPKAQNAVNRCLDKVPKAEYLKAEEKLECYKKAAEQLGSYVAQYHLAESYYNGDGTAQDLAKAYEQYKKAADQGHAKAQYEVGRFLQEGLGGIKKAEKEAYSYYAKAAQQACAEAQLALAWCDHDGIGAAKDRPQAYGEFKAVAEKGLPEAQYMVGRYLEEGWGEVKADEAGAFQCYQKAAEKGHPGAQYRLGRCYFKGSGIEADKAQAFDYFQQAADGDIAEAPITLQQDVAAAQNMLGQYYEKGWVEKKDRKKAREWYYKASANGSEEAARHLLRMRSEERRRLAVFSAVAVLCLALAAYQALPLGEYKLAQCYFTGSYVAQDLNAAYQWFAKAAEGGNAEAQNMVGRYLDEGFGRVRVDKKGAFQWYQRAAEQGLAEAQYNLAQCHRFGKGTAEDLQTAYLWYRRAAEQGFAAAENEVGRYLEFGWGSVPVDVQEAFAWYTKAAKQGNAWAQYNLGWCHFKGIGTQEDIDQALKYFKMAADNNNAYAQNMMGVYYENGWGSLNRNKYEALKWYKRARYNGHREAAKNYQRLAEEER